MNNIQAKKGVVWLSKIGLYFYIDGLPSIYNMPFFGESVKFFDVIDEDKLTKQLEDFFVNNKFPPINVFFIVGKDAVIENEFVLGNEPAINSYLEMIPYESVYSSRTLKPKSILISAFNGDFYRIVGNVIEKNYGKIISLLPYSSISQTALTPQTASLILKKAESLKNESMIDSTEKSSKEDTATLPLNTHGEKSNLPVLLSIFIILLIALSVLVFITNRPQNPVVNTNPTPSPIIFPTPTVFQSIEPDATSSAL